MNEISLPSDIKWASLEEDEVFTWSFLKPREASENTSFLLWETTSHARERPLLLTPKPDELLLWTMMLSTTNAFIILIVSLIFLQGSRRAPIGLEPTVATISLLNVILGRHIAMMTVSKDDIGIEVGSVMRLRHGSWRETSVASPTVASLDRLAHHWDQTLHFSRDASVSEEMQEWQCVHFVPEVLGVKERGRCWLIGFGNSDCVGTRMGKSYLFGPASLLNKSETCWV